MKETYVESYKHMSRDKKYTMVFWICVKSTSNFQRGGWNLSQQLRDRHDTSKPHVQPLIHWSYLWRKIHMNKMDMKWSI